MLPSKEQMKHIIYRRSCVKRNLYAKGDGEEEQIISGEKMKSPSGIYYLEWNIWTLIISKGTVSGEKVKSDPFNRDSGGENTVLLKVSITSNQRGARGFESLSKFWLFQGVREKRNFFLISVEKIKWNLPLTTFQGCSIFRWAKGALL